MGDIEKARKILDVNDIDRNKSNIHWLYSDESEIDEPEDRCFSCAKKKAEKLSQELDVEVRVDGGYESYRESDVPSVCEDCGCRLSYSLTEAGIEYELGHFLSDNVTINVSNESYELERVLDGYENYDKQKERILKLAKKIIDTSSFHGQARCKK